MPSDIDSILGRVSGGNNLSFNETSAAIDAIMRGRWSDEQIGLLLTALPFSDVSECAGHPGHMSIGIRIAPPM